MLVRFHKGFTLEGETYIEEQKHFWSRTRYVRKKIYLNTGVQGFCDESEVEAEVERLTQKAFDQDGWGRNFTGWERVVPYDEMLKIAEEGGWDNIDQLPKNELTIDTLEKWSVQNAAKNLNAKQFGQYCRDYGILVPHARWIVPDEHYPDTCSNCKFEFVWDGDEEYHPRFCPNCGADMREGNK